MLLLSKEMNTLFILFLVCFLIESNNSLKLFNDDPPPDYFKRTDLRDCQRRFHQRKSSVERCCNGVEAISGEFMHMAAIGWNTSGMVEYKCGGTLITSKFILTAAHCASDRNGNRPVTVRLGDTNLEQDTREHPGQQIKIKSFRKHEHFSARRRYDDIALIELAEEVKFNQFTCPACLWLEQSVPAEQMTAIGFGATGIGEELSPTLQKVHLSKLDENRCLEHVQDLRVIPDGLRKGQFCANGHNQDTSEGDSGGPLQTERITLSGIVIPLIVGITSFGTACSYNSVGVYTRVASYKEWIEQVTGKSFNYSSCVYDSGCSFRIEQFVLNSAYEPPRHHVKLLWDRKDESHHQCGATLVDYQFALTSASCVSVKRGSPKFIDAELEIVPIERIHIHPSNAPDKPQYDVALIKLTKYLNPSDTLLPACFSYMERFQRQGSVMKYAVGYNNFIVSLFIGNGECINASNKRNNLLCGFGNNDFIPTMCELSYGGPVLLENDDKDIHDYLI